MIRQPLVQLLLLLAPTLSASALTFNVTTFYDTIDPSDGVTSLREAIRQANAIRGSHTIELSEGTYQLDLYGPGEDAAATGDLDVAKNVTIRGEGHTRTIIDGSRARDRIFHLHDTSRVTLEKLTVDGGETSANGGGCLVPSGANLSLVHANVNNCQASNGGGIYLEPNATLSLQQSRHINSEATGDGGGIFASEGATVSIERCTINACRAGGSGGGIAAASNSMLSVRASVFSTNRAKVNGGSISTSGTLQVNDSSFSRNLVIEGSLPTGHGGAIWSAGTSLEINQSTFAENTAFASGGAIFIDGAIGATSKILHCTLASNICDQGRSGTAKGGALFVRHSTLTLGHTIIAENSDLAAPYEHDLDLNQTQLSIVQSLGHNFIGRRPTEGLGALAFPAGDPNANNDHVGTEMAPLDPMLGELENNGGSQLTLLPLHGSPVINAGDPNASAAGAFPVPANDQRNYPNARIALGRIDIGAVEMQDEHVIYVDKEFGDDANPGNGTKVEAKKTIAAGLQALSNHGTLKLSAHVYDAHTYAIGKDVTIEGAGAGLTILSGVGERRVVWIPGGQEVRLQNLTIRDGFVDGATVAARGAGISVDPGAMLTLTNVVVSDCEGPYVDGAGISVVDATMIAENCQIQDCQGQHGGGLHQSGASTLSLANCSIIANRGLTGGGMYLDDEGAITLTQCTLSGNISDTAGGGIHYSGNDSQLTLRHTTITDNTASTGNGGGFWVTGASIVFDHTIVAGNHASSESHIDISTSVQTAFTTLGHNVIGSNTGIGNPTFPITTFPMGLPNSNSDYVGTESQYLLPLLRPLADNGGRTLTHLPTDSSPAHDGGSPLALPGFAGVPASDQRGAPRANVSGVIDIGATELGSIAPVPSPPTFAGSAPFSAPLGAQREIIALGELFEDLDDGSASLALSLESAPSSLYLHNIEVNDSLKQLIFDVNPSVLGAASVTLRATDPAGNSITGTLTINLTGNAFQQWQNDRFSNLDLSDPDKEATTWGESADPDGDGRANAIEAYHGSNPNVAEEEGDPFTYSHINDSSSQYEFRWQRASDTHGVTAIPVWSPDMESWFATGEGNEQAKVIVLSTFQTNPSAEMQARVMQVTEDRIFAKLIYIVGD